MMIRITGPVVLCLMPVGLTIALAGCGVPAPAAPALHAIDEVVELSSPAGPGSSEPFLVAGADGVVYLSWQEPTDPALLASASTRRGAFRMRMAARVGGAWTDPRTVAEGDFSANWANFPSLLRLPDGTLAAQYAARPAKGEGDYGFVVRFSRDDGATWTDPVAAGAYGEPRGSFVALFPWADGSLAGIWLDEPRDGEPDVAGARARQGMTLRYGRFGVTGTVIEQHVVDPLVCSCCQNAAAVADAGPVVVYRGRTPEEVRDIHVLRVVDGRWTKPRTVHDDGWVIPACPVNGPAIAARGNDVVVAWFTAAGDEGRVKVAFSRDGGATFGEALRVDDGTPIGRVDVGLLDDGTAVVSWLERTETAAEIRVRRFAASGESGPSSAVATASRERPSGFPRMVRQGRELFFAWSSPGKPGQVRVARATVPE
jgi:hypothetical protein